MLDVAREGSSHVEPFIDPSGRLAYDPAGLVTALVQFGFELQREATINPKCLIFTGFFRGSPATS